MNVLKRAFLYNTRKKGRSLTLFLLFALITLFVTISFSALSATQAAATNLRETVGASFTLRGKLAEFSADEANFSVQFIFQTNGPKPPPLGGNCFKQQNINPPSKNVV